MKTLNDHLEKKCKKKKEVVWRCGRENLEMLQDSETNRHTLGV